jgi:hypothetical protein
VPELEPVVGSAQLLVWPRSAGLVQYQEGFSRSQG